MTREQAAQFLGLSQRTLARLEKANRLPSRKEKTSKGHVLVYDLADLERLKAEYAARAQKPATTKPPRLRRVTFGLLPHDYAELAKEAMKYDLKPGEYARRLMREALESHLRAELKELREQEKKTGEEVKRLRNDVAGAFEALLEFLKLSPQEASEWVTENLR